MLSLVLKKVKKYVCNVNLFTFHQTHKNVLGLFRFVFLKKKFFVEWKTRKSRLLVVIKIMYVYTYHIKRTLPSITHTRQFNSKLSLNYCEWKTKLNCTVYGCIWNSMWHLRRVQLAVLNVNKMIENAHNLSK